MRICRSLGVMLLLVSLLPLGALAASKLAGVAEVELTPATFAAQLARLTDEEGRLQEGSVFRFAPGEYLLEPTPYNEALCGNCEDPATPVTATVGLRLSGRGIVFEGDVENPESVVIRTRAGYGLLFEDCQDCVLRGVTITGGARDADPKATCAAIVARDAVLDISDCVITENLGDSAIVAQVTVGIIGIAGREGAQLTIRRNRIVRNSWDGIALYRGAEALIEDNLIDGVDKAGRQVGGGRGVGIGVTWDAKAEIRRNRVTRYWKGIGIFVDAVCTVEENIVEEMLTWGIAVWDGGKGGRPVAKIRRNLVFETGASGISINRLAGGEPAPGFVRENILTRTGRDPRYDSPERYGAQCPLAVQNLPPSFTIGENWSWDNRRPEGGAGGADRGGSDLGDAAFKTATRKLVKTLRKQHALRGARCWRELPN